MPRDECNICEKHYEGGEGLNSGLCADCHALVFGGPPPTPEPVATADDVVATPAEESQFEAGPSGSWREEP